MSEPIEFIADLADLLGNPHQTFTRQVMRSMVETKRELVLRDKAGEQIGYATVYEQPNTEHFYLKATVTRNSDVFFSAFRNTDYSPGFVCPLEPYHAPEALDSMGNIPGLPDLPAEQEDET